MKRRTRRWLIVALGLAAIAGGGAAFYRTFVDPSSSTAELYVDTGLSAGEDGLNRSVCVERPGHMTLALARGKPAGTFSTEHASWERVAVEVRHPAPGDRIDLTQPGVRVNFFVYDGRMFWRIGAGGVRGHLSFAEVSDRRVTVEYDIVVAGYCQWLVPERRNRDFEFRGRATFQARSRPAGDYGGDLWPGPVGPKRPE